MKTFHCFLSFLFVFSLSNHLISQPGSLDLTFGNDGIVIAPDFDYEEQGYSVAVQADGKILLAGFQNINLDRNFAVARYNADGSLDDTFGNGGFAIFDAGTESDAAEDIAIQADGKILLGGYVFSQSTTFDDFALVRLNTDGTPDNTFGTNGIVITDIDGRWDNAFGLAIQDDGKILLGGDGYISDKRRPTLVRYNDDGSLDPTFDGDGIAMQSIGCSDDRTRDIALQDDGKILLCGFFSDGLDDHTFVARFNSDGSVDDSFGSWGAATMDIGGNDDRLLTMCMQDDGKILVGGYTRDTSGNMDYLLMRYMPDGTTDDSFGSNGIFLMNEDLNDLVLGLTVQPDGKILSTWGAYYFRLARHMPDGSLDTGFGDNGLVSTYINSSAYAQSLCLQNDGKVVVAGHSRQGSNDYDFSLARYYTDESGFIPDVSDKIVNAAAYPNPVAGNVFLLEYTLGQDDAVSIELISNRGEVLQVFLEHERKKAGPHSELYTFDQKPGAGLYFLRISTPLEQKGIKLVIR
jgi:uncharacterized delta-60 repeat protein